MAIGSSPKAPRWIAHDGLRLTLAKPIELRVADGSGAGHYYTLIDKGLLMPVENDNVLAANSQFVCADPRNGVAVFELVKPTRVGLVQAARSARRCVRCRWM